MKRIGWVLAILGAGMGEVMAAPADGNEDIFEFDPVVVTGHKYPLHQSEVAGQIGVIDQEDIEKHLVENLDQLFRYEPSAGTQAGDTRFGVSGVSIRGVGGNRVAIEVDGVPIRNGFAIGSYSNAGRALVETDRIKRVELYYGPASVLYGSDALGGILSFSTWDPGDRVRSADDTTWFGARAGYQSADRSTVGNAGAAWSDGEHGALVSATLRHGHETESAAVGREQLDPQTWRGLDFAARYTFDSPYGHAVRLGIEHFEREVDTEVASRLGYGRLAQVTALSGDDDDQSTRALLDVDFSTEWLDTAVARTFLDASRTRQHTREERGRLEPPLYLERSFELDSDLWGIELNGFRSFRVGTSEHRLGLGLEFLSTHIEELRDGFQQDLESGDITRVILGEVLPTRDFPNSSTREFSLFLEDVISFDEGTWTLSPALRFERYALRSHPDELYLESFPDQATVNLDESSLTPRLSARYAFNTDWSAYGQVSRGFRAPPVEDVNIGFELPLLRYRAIPNPDLVSETSVSYEFGVRRHVADGRLALTWFDTRFDDLIESRAFKGFDPASGYLEFQSRNIGKARIYGIDVRWDQGLEAWSPALDGWTLRTAALWSRGENQTDDQPLNSVLPPQLIAGLKWRSGSGDFDAELITTWTDAVERVDLSAGPRFLPSSATEVDFVAGWRLSPAVSLRFGLFNVLDETWWRWSDVQNLEADDPVIPLLAQPGRNFSVSLRFEG